MPFAHRKLRPTQVFRRKPRFYEKDIKYLSLDIGWQDPNDYVQSQDDEDVETSSVTSYSTNATADNIPGPGRLLDNLYQFLGRRLERVIMRFGPFEPNPAQILRFIMQTYSRQVVFLVLLDTNEIMRRLPHDEAAGLRSLAKQTQSTSVYRSAAALCALIQCSTSDNQGGYDLMPSLYCIIARAEPIFQLEILLQSLDDSHHEKAVLLSLINLARSHYNLLNGTLTFSRIGYFSHLWKVQLLDILGLRRKAAYDPAITFVRACTLYASVAFYISENALHIEHDIADIIYFINIFLLHVISADYTPIINEPCPSKLKRLVLSTSLRYIDAAMSSVLHALSGLVTLETTSVQCAAMLRSPIYLIPHICRQLLPGTFSKSMYALVDPSILPRRVRFTSLVGNNPRTINNYAQAWLPRTRRLMSSLDELEKEARGDTPALDRIIPLSELRHPFLPARRTERLRNTFRQARKVNVGANALTAEFLSRRDNPDLNKGDLWYWAEYKGKCQYRHRWGELLRSNLNWDWDPSDCLVRLFEVVEPVIELSGEQGTLHPSIAMELENPLKEIRIPYKSQNGRVKYRTYKICPSVEDISIAPTHPPYESSAPIDEEVDAKAKV